MRNSRELNKVSYNQSYDRDIMVLYVVNKDCRLDHLGVKGLEVEMQ